MSDDLYAKNGVMEKDSWADYIIAMRRKGFEIDKSTDKLADTWKTPHLLIGGYAERTAETDACLDQLKESLQDVNDNTEKLQSELKPFLKDTDQLLKESEIVYQDLKEQCDNLDIVLAEYGYRYKEDDSVQEELCRDNSNNNTNDSILRDEADLPDLEIEITPQLTWRKSRSKNK